MNLRFDNVKSTQGTSSNENSSEAGGEFKENNRLPKIDFPYFGGERPREWLRKASKYFQLHQVPNELILEITEMYMKGNANIWFDGFISSYPKID